MGKTVFNRVLTLSMVVAIASLTACGGGSGSGGNDNSNTINVSGSTNLSIPSDKFASDQQKSMLGLSLSDGLGLTFSSNSNVKKDVTITLASKDGVNLIDFPKGKSCIIHAGESSCNIVLSAKAGDAPQSTETLSYFATGGYNVIPNSQKFKMILNELGPQVIPGWAKGKITMGTISDNSAEAKEDLLKRPSAAIYTYAGSSGSGDAGNVMVFHKSGSTSTSGNMKQETKIPLYLGEAKLSAYEQNLIFVVYTADASGGGTAGATGDLKGAALQNHYQTLIDYATYLEAYYQKNNIRATLVLNPDFLGNILKDGTLKPTDNILSSGSYASNLATAIASRVADKDEIPLVTNKTVPGDTAKAKDLISYVQSINWIMGAYAPDINYGWEDADWAGNTDANKWYHGATKQDVTNSVSNELNYLNQVGLAKNVDVGNGEAATHPNFIAFDKYGANPIFAVLATDKVNSNNVDAGFLFNVSDWDAYISYTSQVAKALKLPLMLFQIPGAHLPNSTDSIRNLATFPDYLFGSSDINFDMFSNIPGKITKATYNTTATTPGDYLLADGKDAWNKSRLATLAHDDNVFAILWGGGGFATGTISQGPAFDDGGWLYKKIDSSSPDFVSHPRVKSIPSINSVDKWPKNIETYDVGDYVSDNGHLYKCLNAGWCKAQGYKPSGINGKAAWKKII